MFRRRIEEELGSHLHSAAAEHGLHSGAGVDDLERNARDAVRCHFNEDERRRLARLHFAVEEAIAV